MLRWMLKLGFG